MSENPFLTFLCSCDHVHAFHISLFLLRFCSLLQTVVPPLKLFHLCGTLLACGDTVALKDRTTVLMQPYPEILLYSHFVGKHIFNRFCDHSFICCVPVAPHPCLLSLHHETCWLVSAILWP